MATISEALPGARFGRLTVVRTEKIGGKFFASCRCQCGTERRARVSHLGRYINGRGCKMPGCNPQRGHAVRTVASPTLNAWRAMIARCSVVTHSDWKRYGGRGISVCQRWVGRGGFANFIADIGVKPSGMSLDRVDNNGNYEPSNVRWATIAEQNRNRRSTKFQLSDVERIVSGDLAGASHEQVAEMFKTTRRYVRDLRASVRKAMTLTAHGIPVTEAGK